MYEELFESIEMDEYGMSFIMLLVIGMREEEEDERMV